MTATVETSTLESIFDPRSVAVVGASADPRKWGHWLARGALAGRDRRAVGLVNHSGADVLGVTTARRLVDLDVAPDVVVITTPPAHVRGVAEEALACGARYLVVITTGVGDPATVTAEQDVVELVRSHGARLLGPNCMGVVDTGTDLALSWGDFPRGAVGLVSQSGNIGLELGRMLGRVGHGFSRFISLGNQLDIDAADAVETLVLHPETEVVAAYIEHFRDGRRLARTFQAVREAGKPLLLLTVGRSDASGRAAQSHTGAMVSGSDVVDAMCVQSGALRVETSGELVDTVQALLAPAAPLGRRVVILGDSGGQGALAADAMVAHGLDVPQLDEGTTQRLREVLPANAGVSNPVDLAGAGEADLQTYPRLAALLDGPGTDVTLLTGYFGDYATDSPALGSAELAAATRVGEVVRETGRLVIVHSMAQQSPVLIELRRHGVPVYERIESAARAVANVVAWRSAVPVRTPAMLPAAEAVASGDYPDVRRLLASYGVPFSAAEFVETEDDAVDALLRIGGAVALKAMGLAHKTEAGGVRLGITEPEELRRELREMRARTGMATYAVEAMQSISGSVELIMGVRRDPSFGPVAMVGIGGVTAELLADTAVGLAPLDLPQARRMIASLRHAPLLTGWRGSRPVDLDAATEALAGLARAGAEHPELVELEINPLLVHPGGAVALDAAAALAPDRR